MSATNPILPARLRKFPWPYQAMLALSSDTDNAKIELFRQLYRFANTHVETPIFGRGVGLELAGSFWFYNLPGRQDTTTTYFADQGGYKVRPTAPEMIEYIKAGWIDTLHTYGNFNAGRFRTSLADRAVGLADAVGVRFPVWVDHGNANNIQNLFSERRYEAAAHLDCMRALGVEFAADPSMSAVFGRDSVISPANLADGSRIWSFERNCRIAGIEDKAAFAEKVSKRFRRKIRFKSGRDGASATVWHPPFLSVQISRDRLRALVKARHFVVVGQHLEYVPDPGYITRDFIVAFRRLARFHERGQILVASTSRLLRYNVVYDHLTFTARSLPDREVIDIGDIDDPVRGRRAPLMEELAGVQFEVQAGRPVEIHVAGRPVAAEALCRHDEDGAPSVVGFPWHEPDHTDYVALCAAELRDPDAEFGDAADPMPKQHQPTVEACRARRAMPYDTQTLKDLYEAARGSAEAAGLPADRLNYAIDRGLVLFGRGLDHYRDVLARIGFESGERLLDIGCGSAHWLLAALPGYESVTGIDVSEEYIYLACRVAESLRLSDRMEVSEGSAHNLPFPDSRFDHVLSHSVFHFLDTELAFAEVERVLRPGGRFYCGVTGPGARLRIALSGVEAGNLRQAEIQLKNFMGGAVRRAGLAAAFFSTVRSLTLRDYVAVAEAYGLHLIATPNVQDVIRGFPNFPGTFDFVLAKPETPDSPWERFQRRLAHSGTEPEAFLTGHARGALPHLARRAAEEGWAELDADARARLMGWTELAIQEMPNAAILDAAADALDGETRLRDTFNGLREFGAGRFGEARKHFSAAGDRGDAALMAATCLLRRNKGEAEKQFRLQVKRHPERLWSWAGLLMATVQAGGGGNLEQAARLARRHLVNGGGERV